MAQFEKEKERMKLSSTEVGKFGGKFAVQFLIPSIKLNACTEHSDKCFKYWGFKTGTEAEIYLKLRKLAAEWSSAACGRTLSQ